jgi:tRNA threonylcarbamoyladenosine modification (KEOPS) complex  Pcc1 subunit
MSSKTRATVKILIPDWQRLEIVFEALEPEVKKPATMRSKTLLEKDGRFLVLKTEAKDTVALRAALNAYLRWINSLMNVLEVLKTR